MTGDRISPCAIPQTKPRSIQHASRNESWAGCRPRAGYRWWRDCPLGRSRVIAPTPHDVPASLLLDALQKGFPTERTPTPDREEHPMGTRRFDPQSLDRLREEVRGLHAQGLRHRQIALQLGISPTTVSVLKAELRSASRLPARAAIPIAASVGAVRGASATGRSRSEILVEYAALRATTLSAVTRSLLDHVVGADEWVTDPDFPNQVRAVIADAVIDAMGRLDQVAEHMGLARGDARRAGGERA